MNKFFKPIHFSKKSKARLGEIKTAHGTIKTPAFMPAATKGTIKSLPLQFIKDIGIQVSFVNTYHLVCHPGAEIIKEAGGIHKYSQLNMPLMSDSGGFQVFSLARTEKARSHKFLSPLEPPRSREVQSQKNLGISPLRNETRKADIRGEEQPFLVKISEDGVQFRSTFDGKLIEFTPEKSMEYQAKIGADINMAFDECTYYPSGHDYAKKAMDRTHRWLERCVKYKKNFQFTISNLQYNSNDSISNENLNIENLMKIENGKLKISQYLYGVIQGGTFEDLRKKSAEFVVSQDTPGVAIGGVSVGESKAEMRDQVRWVSDYLPKDRPVHLLGVGQIDDIIDLVKYGIDTFDCVEPTRLARMGTIYQVRYQNFLSPVGPLATSWQTSQVAKNLVSSPVSDIDISKTIYKNNLGKVDVNCDCYVCQNFTKSYLHHLFKQREILGYTLATFHNLWVMERLFEKIRELISKDLI